jgi:hypothetical protein
MENVEGAENIPWILGQRYDSSRIVEILKLQSAILAKSTLRAI